MNGEVYAVSSGSYSDYQVHCIFEARDDAIAYAKALAEASLLGVHKTMAKAVRKGRASGFDPHTDPQETCEVCVRIRASWRESDFNDYGVEQFQFFASGNVPVVGQEDV